MPGITNDCGHMRSPVSHAPITRFPSACLALTAYLLLATIIVASPLTAQPRTERVAEVELARYRAFIQDVPGFRLRPQPPIATRPTDEVALSLRVSTHDADAGTSVAPPLLFRQVDTDGDGPIAAVGDSVRLMRRDGSTEHAVVVHRAYFEVDEQNASMECTIYAPTWFLSLARESEALGSAGAGDDPDELWERALERDRDLIALPARVRHTYPLQERDASAADAQMLRAVLDTLTAHQLFGWHGADERADSALRAIKRELAQGRVPRGLRAATADEPGVDAQRLVVLRLPVPTGNMCETDYGTDYPPDCEGHYVAPVRLVMRGDGRLRGIISAWWDSPAQDIRAVYETDNGERGLVTAAGLASLRAGWMQLRSDGPRANRLYTDCD